MTSGLIYDSSFSPQWGTVQLDLPEVIRGPLTANREMGSLRNFLNGEVYETSRWG